MGRDLDLEALVEGLARVRVDVEVLVGPEVADARGFIQIARSFGEMSSGL